MPADEAPSGRDSNPIPPCKHESRAPGASCVLREAAVSAGATVDSSAGRSVEAQTRRVYLPVWASSLCSAAALYVLSGLFAALSIPIAAVCLLLRSRLLLVHAIDDGDELLNGMNPHLLVDVLPMR